MITSWEEAYSRRVVTVWAQDTAVDVYFSKVVRPTGDNFEAMRDGRLTPILVELSGVIRTNGIFGMSVAQAEELALAILDQVQFVRGELEKEAGDDRN